MGILSFLNIAHSDLVAEVKVNEGEVELILSDNQKLKDKLKQALIDIELGKIKKTEHDLFKARDLDLQILHLLRDQDKENYNKAKIILKLILDVLRELSKKDRNENVRKLLQQTNNILLELFINEEKVYDKNVVADLSKLFFSETITEEDIESFFYRHSAFFKVKPNKKLAKKIRKELLAYLEHSPISDNLSHIIKNIIPSDWINIIEKTNSQDEAQILLGGCRRALESYTGHPGILLLAAFARILLPNYGIESALDDFERSFMQLQIISTTHVIQEEAFICDLLEVIHNKGYPLSAEFYSLVAKYFPYRRLAKNIYPFAPTSAVNVFIYHLSDPLQQFSLNYLKDGKYD